MKKVHKWRILYKEAGANISLIMVPLCLEVPTDWAFSARSQSQRWLFKVPLLRAVCASVIKAPLLELYNLAVKISVR